MRTPVYIYVVCDIVERIIEFANLYQLSISPDDEGYLGYNNSYNAYHNLVSEIEEILATVPNSQAKRAINRKITDLKDKTV